MKTIKNLEEEFIKTIDNCTGIINSLCHVYSSSNDDFKDARQEVILQCWKSYNSFNHECNVKTWVYKVTLNTLLNRKRKERVEQSKFISLDIDEVLNLPLQKMSFYSDDDFALLNQLLKSLSNENKALMTLYLEGYKYHEIAKILNISSSNVSTKINRIKAQFSSLIKKSNYEY